LVLKDCAGGARGEAQGGRGLRRATTARPPAGPVQKAVLLVVVVPEPSRLEETKMVPLGVIDGVADQARAVGGGVVDPVVGVGQGLGPLSGLPKKARARGSGRHERGSCTLPAAVEEAAAIGGGRAADAELSSVPVNRMLPSLLMAGLSKENVEEVVGLRPGRARCADHHARVDELALAENPTVVAAAAANRYEIRSCMSRLHLVPVVLGRDVLSCPPHEWRIGNRNTLLRSDL
jgi:hypothetical protein